MTISSDPRRAMIEMMDRDAADVGQTAKKNTHSWSDTARKAGRRS
jgi:hypothetical protein